MFLLFYDPFLLNVITCRSVIFMAYLRYHCINILWFIYQLYIWDVSCLTLFWLYSYEYRNILWIICPDTNIQEFHNWWYQFLLPCNIYEFAKFHIFTKILALLKFLIFTNNSRCRMLFCYGLNLYSLIFDSIENLFIGLWCFCVCSSVKRKCLFMIFANFSICLFSSAFALILYEITCCFFRCLSPAY